MNTAPTTCRHCNGTGYRLEHARVDGGRCWRCNKVDTSYAIPGTPAWVAAQARFAAEQAEMDTERAARRAARRAAKA